MRMIRVHLSRCPGYRLQSIRVILCERSNERAHVTADKLLALII